MKLENYRGQVTIFIIIAILIIAAVVGVFLVRNAVGTVSIPASLEPVYATFLDCLEEDSLVGVGILESQGGYIQLPDFEPGSEYMPFSSQLVFLGNPIPYWYYVAGNNVQKEQMPSKSDMAEELEEFVNGKIRGCVLDSYYEQGFDISLGEPESRIRISKSKINVGLSMDLSISKGEDSTLVSNHRISVDSNLGKLYDSAVEIYEKEQRDLFLEEYAIDTLRLYAPVDGVEIECSPQVWGADEVFDDLERAVESNTLALKVKGGDYTLNDKENEYFVIDANVDENVRFINSVDWPNSFEVSPTEGNVLMASPVGNQPGLGILGFCYIPYHFVYDVKYPVLVQVYEEDEIFQFPLAVVIQGNVPREALETSATGLEVSELCKNKNTQLEVRTYNTRLNPVDAEISYKCSGTVCSIGATSGGILDDFPQCANGYVLAKAEGYRDEEYLYSTTTSGSIDIILDKLYETEVDLKLGGEDYSGEAIVTFVSSESFDTLVYPLQKTIALSEGQYEVQVYVYRNSSLKIASTTSDYCVDVPQSGFGALLELTEEKCFDVSVPEQIISNALAGGGKGNYYILESELAGNSVLEISAESLPVPKTIEELQQNYVLFESKDLDIVFK